jgi:hypothetical protein
MSTIQKTRMVRIVGVLLPGLHVLICLLAGLLIGWFTKSECSNLGTDGFWLLCSLTALGGVMSVAVQLRERRQTGTKQCSQLTQEKRK